MDPGCIINSLFGSPKSLKCVHFGDADMDFASSVILKIPDCQYVVCTESNLIPPEPNVKLMAGNPLSLDGLDKFDLVVIPGGYSQFATAVYMSIEAILKEGGVVAVTEPKKRLELMKAMTKEGAIAPYHRALYDDNEFWLFRLENDRLNREL